MTETHPLFFIGGLAAVICLLFLYAFYAEENLIREQEYAKTANCGYIDSIYANKVHGMGSEARLIGSYKYNVEHGYSGDEVVKQYHLRCHPSDKLDIAQNWDWGTITIKESQDKVVVEINKKNGTESP